ncbi:hypothetical protein BO221_32335 [Archangium sp. Cb G35]|nr:hypothetical protein BO221_32335 [Archangium sp. Cb G35]
MMSSADSCHPCVAARPPEEQLPTRRPEAAVVQAPKDRSSKAVPLGWFGLLLGGLSAVLPLVSIIQLPLMLLCPMVMLILGKRAWVMARCDLEDIYQERIPLEVRPAIRGRATHARVLGVLNILGGLLGCIRLSTVVSYFGGALF